MVVGTVAEWFPANGFMKFIFAMQLLCWLLQAPLKPQHSRELETYAVDACTVHKVLKLWSVDNM